MFPLRHCLLLAPNRLLGEKPQEGTGEPSLKYFVLATSLAFFARPSLDFEIQYAALLQTVCSLLFSRIARSEFVSTAACVITPQPRLR